MLERSYVVTISSGNQIRSRLWKGRGPLPLGYPYRWVLERSEDGIRIRDLQSKEDEIVDQRVSEIAPEVIESGLPVLIPNSSASVRIKPVAMLPPAFQSRPNPAGKIQVYSCMGSWSLGSQSVGSQYLAKVREREIFEFRKVNEGYVFAPRVPDLSMEIASAPVQVSEGAVRVISHEEICQTVLRWGLMSWVFSSFDNVALPSLTTRQGDPEWSIFKQSLGASAIILALVAALAVLWPHQKSTELVPPQFAKLVMEPKGKAKAAPKSETKATQTETKNATPATRSRVTEAFRVQALQSAVNGLLKGGMTKLLQQSEFVGGTGQSVAARSVLSAKSQGLLSTAPSIGLMAAKAVAVGSVGGTGIGAAGREHVGYGSGEHALVDGQGRSFLSLDTGASSVEEGLTKDEVGEVIHRHISEIRYCYEATMVRTADVEGKLTLGFTISGTGAVKSAEVRNSTLTDPGLDDCVVRRLSTWKFPQTKGGIDVSVNYPFIFKSLGR